jgi:predicted GH43/DUF377 family glycosyl hydrolase
MRTLPNRISHRLALLVAAVVTVVAVSSNNATVSQAPDACVKYAGNPVLTPGPAGSWDQGAIGREFVYFNGSAYNMWYTAFSTTLAIGFASSKDGVHWTKYPSPVLKAGPSGSWDSGGVEAPSVVWNGTLFLMYYTGSNGTLASDIGVAFSRDMIHWQKYSGNPVLRHGPGSYDSFYAKYSDVIYDTPLYKMWYTARASAGPVNGTLYTIAYATSTDGLRWTKYAGNPVITPNISSRKNFYIAAKYPHVLKVDGLYLMVLLFTDGADTISLAVSTDGVSWNSTGTSLLSNTNNPLDWDYVPYYPSAILNGTTLLVWYSGRTNTSPTPPPSVGLAYCSLILARTTVSITTAVTVTRISSTTIPTPERVPISEPPVYRVMSTVLAVTSGVLVILLLEERARHGRKSAHS